MAVRVELARIIISEISDYQVIYLKETEGERAFPISIGLFEATSIKRRIRGVTTPRPLTHDLLLSIVESVGGRLKDVVIHDLDDATFFANLRVQHGEESLDIDARPSDAIAIAVSCDPQLPIFVEEEVFTKVGL
jgi:uncharacterized protein